MAEQSDELQQLLKIVDEAGGEGPYMCPCCYYRLPTHEAKTEHLARIHGYDTLQVSYG